MRPSAPPPKFWGLFSQGEKMKISVDLTDVAAHAVLSEALTGIQRVQIECSKALFQLDRTSTEIFANVYNNYHGLDQLFAAGGPKSTSDIFNEIRRLYRINLPRKLPLRVHVANGLLKLKRARDNAPEAQPRTLRLGASDILYVGGAFWAHPRSVQTYERAAQQGCDLVVLFHDLISVTFPHLTDGGARPSFERMLRLPARAIAVSRYTAAQLEEARRVVGAPQRLLPPTIVPLAHEFSGVPRNQPALRAPSRRTAALERLRAFVLCVGTIELRKNHAGLIRLWESLAREAGASWPKLVVAGRCGWGAEETFRRLKRADPHCPYRWIDAPTDEELAWLYGRASFTVFPSLAEGWGLPIGESLWFGKPCVASNTTSMPEVGGDLCAYADPHRIDSFAPPIIRLVHDDAYYAASVGAIKARPLRTWAEAANDIAASVCGFDATRLSGSRPAYMAHGRDEAGPFRPKENRAPARG